MFRWLRFIYFIKLCQNYFTISAMCWKENCNWKSHQSTKTIIFRTFCFDLWLQGCHHITILNFPFGMVKIFLQNNQFSKRNNQSLSKKPSDSHFYRWLWCALPNLEFLPSQSLSSLKLNLSVSRIVSSTVSFHQRLPFVPFLSSVGRI